MQLTQRQVSNEVNSPPNTGPRLSPHQRFRRRFHIDFSHETYRPRRSPPAERNRARLCFRKDESNQRLRGRDGERDR